MDPLGESLLLYLVFIGAPVIQRAEVRPAAGCRLSLPGLTLRRLRLLQPAAGSLLQRLRVQSEAQTADQKLTENYFLLVLIYYPSQETRY